MRRLLLTCFELFHLIVGASSDGFYFTVNPKDQDVEEGAPVRLRCAVTPSKDIYYSWLHNGERVETDQEYGRRYLEAESNLQIPHADRELDPGTYQCQALNRSSTFTTASQEAKVNVYWIEPHVHVTLIKPARYEDIRIGVEVEFACQATAHPPIGQANIKWYHNGNARLPNTETRHNGNLHIAVFGMEHTGSYHCRVVHAAGKLDSRPPFVLHFNDAPSPQLITTLPHEDFSKFVMRGHPLELSCPRFGTQKSMNEIPAITVWGYMPRLGEQQQSVSTLPDVKLTDMDSKLTISHFEPHHVNYYTCEISSHQSPDKYIFVYQVEMATLFTPKRSDFSPRLKKNQPYVVQIGQDAELRYYPDCSPSNSFLMEQISNPTPHIEWHKRGELQPLLTWPTSVMPNDHVLGTLNTDGLVPRVYALRGKHLVIRRATELDAGTYEMVLTNVAGRTVIAFDIIVTFAPEFYQAQPHEEHSFDEDESVTLNCGIKRRAIPGSTVYWEKNQRVLKTYGNGMMIVENNGETLRFSKLKPEHQGHYQCFVQTDGYKKRAAGREQTLVVKGKLQFVRDVRERFLELNSLGRISCKARGHGSLSVKWYRKLGPRFNDLQPIGAPNEVEPGGTLVIHRVQKTDAGDYICIAQSTYKNAQINMTVHVVVGEKPQISHISPNQTVRVGSQLILNCHATGDPPPRISWIAKRAGFVMYTPESEPLVAAHHDGSANDNSKMRETHTADGNVDPMMAALLAQNTPIDKGRVSAYQNGSLVINQASLTDQAEYICVANNKHAVETRQGVFVRVLSLEEYTRQQLGAEGAGSSMLKTIVTVVGCAVTYLGLIVALTVFCSMRMVRKRGKRPTKAVKTNENGQLLTSLGEPNVPNGVASTSQTTGNTLDSQFLLTGVGPMANTTGTTQFAQMHSQHGQPLVANVSGSNNTSPVYPEHTFHRNLRSHLSSPSEFQGSGGSHMTPMAHQTNQDWWSWKNHGYFNPLEMQPKVPHGTPASPLDMTSESAIDSTGLQSHPHVHHLSANSHNYVYNGHTTGGDNSTTATSASDLQIMSVPPPTPLDSRSHFSGLSSGNSTSLYSRSVLSGASNAGGPQSGSGTQNISDTSPIHFLSNGGTDMSQTDRMHYPRCELKVEHVLGKGAFGDVFLARACHIREDETQSLILVKSLVSHESQHVNEFHRQLEMFGKLNHSHVTRLLGICMEQEPFYMLLEYTDWGDLKMFLRRIREGDNPSIKMRALSCVQKLKMCHQICLGMEQLSQWRCVHRDLAARNILLTSDMELKISHLGICRDLHSTEYYRIPNTEHFIPLRWFAPELIAEAFPTGRSNTMSKQLDYGHQITEPSLPYSTHSDMWAFGVLICEIFSLATLPLARLSDQEIINAARQAAHQSNVLVNEPHANNLVISNHSTLRPDIPAEIPLELNTLLLRCWSPVTRQRPEFREMTMVLRDLIS